MVHLIIVTILSHLSNLICNIINIKLYNTIYDIFSICVSIIGVLCSSLLFIVNPSILAVCFSLSCFMYGLCSFFNFRRYMVNGKKMNIIHYIIYANSLIGVVIFFILGLL